MASHRMRQSKRSLSRRERKAQSKRRFIDEWGWLLLLMALTAALVGLVALTGVELPHSPLLPGR